MVTAGVLMLPYVLCNGNGTRSNAVHLDLGAVTLLVAGFAALVQTDINVSWPPTMSQLGYMFMAVGAEAYQAGLFHMLAHAFFKALLFLSSGADSCVSSRTKHFQNGWIT